MIEKECVYCMVKEQEKDENDYTMIGLDRPYVNLFFHRSCLEEIGKENVGRFLQENLEIWYNE